MSDDIRHTAIGAFVVGAIVISIAVLLFINQGGFGRDRTEVVMVFDSSVRGLKVGAPVAFRGVQIGQVTDINLIFDTNKIDLSTEVEAQITPDNITVVGLDEEEYFDELVADGMRAQLLSQSLLTGLLFVQLDFHDDAELRLPPVTTDALQIPTIPTELERLSRNLESVDVEKLIKDVQATITGINQFITSDQFQALPEDLHRALASVETLARDLDTRLAGTIVRLDTVLDGADATVGAVRAQVPDLAGRLQHSLDQFDKAMVGMNSTLNGLDYAVSDDSPTLHRVNEAITELARAGRALQTLAHTLEQHPEALLRGRKQE